MDALTFGSKVWDLAVMASYAEAAPWPSAKQEMRDEPIAKAGRGVQLLSCVSSLNFYSGFLIYFSLSSAVLGWQTLLRHMTYSEARKMPIQEFLLDRVLAELELSMDEVCVDVCCVCACVHVLLSAG